MAVVERREVVIAGAGFAGAATAAALARRGIHDVLILEAEAIPGLHGSGRNAAMARRVIGDPLLARLATSSVAAIDALGAARGLPLLRRSGGLLIGSDADVDRLLAAAAEVAPLAREAERLDRAGLTARVPALAGASAEAGIYTPGCGVVDIHALLTAYLEQARDGGARLALGERIVAVEAEGGRVRGVATATRRIACDVLVNAAGFGANPLATLAGAARLRLDPARRHLFTTAAFAAIDSSWPFVWDMTHGLYFRPEGPGLLMCCCDQTSWAPEDPPSDPAVRELLAETFSAHVPGLEEARPTRQWAGLRVLTPDGRFAIGADPDLAGFFWVAGLGGHGMTTSHGVGELAAAGIADGRLPEPFASGFDPGRPSLRG